MTLYMASTFPLCTRRPILNYVKPTTFDTFRTPAGFDFFLPGLPSTFPTVIRVYNPADLDFFFGQEFPPPIKWWIPLWRQLRHFSSPHWRREKGSSLFLKCSLYFFLLPLLEEEPDDPYSDTAYNFSPPHAAIAF